MGLNNDFVDYYKLLSVDKFATLDEIKKSYHKLSKQYHPDACGGDVEKENKFKLINEAYSVLSNKAKRAEYDIEWERSKTSSFSQDVSDVSDEDVKKYYTEYEERIAREIAFRELIKKEFENIDLIINAKNELILKAYNGEIDKENYYESVKELLNYINEFIINFRTLADTALEYDFLKEREKIIDVINFLENEKMSIPLGVEDACLLFKKVNLKDNLEKNIAREKNDALELIDDLKALIKSVGDGTITHVDYENIRNNMIIKAKDCISKLKEYNKLMKQLDSNYSSDDIFDILKKIKGRIGLTPESVEEVIWVYRMEAINEKVDLDENSLSFYQKKIEKIKRILKKYPRSSHFDFLYQYGLSLFDKISKEFNDDLGVVNDLLENEITLDKIEELSKEALELYEKTCQEFLKNDELFKEVVEEDFFDVGIKLNALENSGSLNLEKIEALELFFDIKLLKEKYEKYSEYDITSLEDLRCKIRQNILTIESAESYYKSDIFRNKDKFDELDELYNSILQERNLFRLKALALGGLDLLAVAGIAFCIKSIVSDDIFGFASFFLLSLVLSLGIPLFACLNAVIIDELKDKNKKIDKRYSKFICKANSYGYDELKLADKIIKNKKRRLV